MTLCTFMLGNREKRRVESEVDIVIVYGVVTFGVLRGFISVIKQKELWNVSDSGLE